MSADKFADYIYKDLTYKIIGCLYEAHKELGSVHKENIYYNGFACHLIHSSLKNSFLIPLHFPYGNANNKKDRLNLLIL